MKCFKLRFISFVIGQLAAASAFGVSDNGNLPSCLSGGAAPARLSLFKEKCIVKTKAETCDAETNKERVDFKIVEGPSGPEIQFEGGIRIFLNPKSPKSNTYANNSWCMINPQYAKIKNPNGDPNMADCSTLNPSEENEAGKDVITIGKVKLESFHTKDGNRTLTIKFDGGREWLKLSGGVEEKSGKTTSTLNVQTMNDSGPSGAIKSVIEGKAADEYDKKTGAGQFQKGCKSPIAENRKNQKNEELYAKRDKSKAGPEIFKGLSGQCFSMLGSEPYRIDSNSDGVEDKSCMGEGRGVGRSVGDVEGKQ